MKIKYLSIIVIAHLISACTYQASAPVAPAVNVYSSYEDKIDGRYVLVVDAADLNRKIAVDGWTCSAHNFPLDAGPAFKASVTRTIEQLVEEVEVAETTQSMSSLKEQGVIGQIVVRAESFTPKLSFIPGFWSASADAKAEISLSVQIDGVDGRLLGTTAGGDGDSRREAGGACEGGAAALSEATGSAMRELMERMGERVSNSQKLRDYVKQRGKMPQKAAPSS